MIYVRSLIFLAYTYVVAVGLVLAYLPTALYRPRLYLHGFGIWGRTTIWGLRHICNVDVVVEGVEHVPHGKALVACKHQSMLETSVLFSVLNKPAIVLKQELTRIPLVGVVVGSAGHIVVNRKGGSTAMQQMVAQARERFVEDRAVLIFPEGTRRDVDAPPAYKRGIASLYSTLGCACTPVALNTGLFWRRHSVLRYPGRCVIRFLPPIQPGLSQDAFLARLSDDIETATAELVAAGRAGR